jgi:hypothetical protein
VCGTPTAGSCFSPHASGACNDLACCNAVCTVDPSCCSTAWDSLCVIAAEQICQPGCEPSADPNAETETEDCSTRSNDPCYVATGGTPQPMSANLQIKGSLGAFVPASAQPDVDVYAITIPDTDGDGLAKVSLAFASSPKAWAAFIPAQACAPMSSAILLMILNFIGLGGGPTLVGILSTNFSADKVAAGMDKALAGAEGLRDALLWMTPFFAVAVFFMVLQYLALRREVKAEGPVSDGGFAAGVLLLLVGVAGLGARYYFGGVAGMTSTDVVPLLQMIMLVVATVLGLFLLLGAGGRKKAAA